MGFTFNKKLPIPKEIKAMYPLSPENAAKKAQRDKEIRDVITAADIFDLREHLVSQIRVCGQIFRHLIHLGNGTAKLLAVDPSFIGLLISTLVLIIINPVIAPADLGGCDHIP